MQQATGIIINKKRGIILTVRHLIKDIIDEDDMVVDAKDFNFSVCLPGLININFPAKIICYSDKIVDLMLI